MSYICTSVSSYASSCYVFIWVIVPEQFDKQMNLVYMFVIVYVRGCGQMAFLARNHSSAQLTQGSQGNGSKEGKRTSRGEAGATNIFTPRYLLEG